MAIPLERHRLSCAILWIDLGRLLGIDLGNCLGDLVWSLVVFGDRICIEHI